MEPVLKWAGGKRQLLDRIIPLIDKERLIRNGGTYFEPFFGAGSVCLNLELPKCVINDLNWEVYNLLSQIKNNKEELIDILKQHEKKHSRDYYYSIREMDRSIEYKELTECTKAARMVYLNHTCFNGLYRVNKNGQFNVPIGKPTNLNIVQEERINKLHSYLNNNQIEILNVDFEKAVIKAKEGDVVYFDPPYDYENENGFVSYVVDGFDRSELIRLKKCCDFLIENGCIVVVSNNDTTFVRELFSQQHYSIAQVDANRSISRNGNKRVGAKEVIVYGKQ